MKPIPFLALVLAAVILPVVVSHAEEDGARHGRRVDPTRQVTLPFEALAFDEGLRITEGPRMLGDVFPYLAAAPRQVSSTRAVEIVPETLPSFLHAAPQEGGHAPARIRTDQAALEAVRLFLAGPIVADEAAGERLIDVGRRLGQVLEHLDVEVTDHRPASWAPTARPLPQDRSMHPTEAWEVSIVAFELDRMLRLVHVTARVTAAGAVTMERKPIVNGPMTTWQTASLGERTDAMRREEDAMHAEASAARRAYAHVLQPARTLDAFWAVGRVLQDMDDVRAVFGEPDRDIGSGIHIWTYDLEDGTSVVFGGSRKRVAYVRHVRGATRPLSGFETLGTIYLGL